MKNLFDKAVIEFYKIPGSNTLKSIKNYIQTKNLYIFKLPHYFNYLNIKDLKTISSLPCPIINDTIDSKNVKISKMIRHSMGVEEKIACNKCPKKDICKQAFIESKATPSIADVVRYIHAFNQNPPNEDIYLSSGINFMNDFHIFISNIEKYPVPLKIIVEENTKTNQPIQVEKKIRPKIKTKINTKIPKQCIWTPKEKDIEKLKDLEKRRKRQSLAKEVDTFIKRTATLVKKNPKGKQKRYSKKKK